MRAPLSKTIVFENKDHSDIGSLMDWKLPWRHEPGGGAAFLATCANRALLGPVGHRASLDLLCALSWVVRGRRLSGGKQAFPSWACRSGIRPERALIESPLPGTVVSRLENVSVLVDTKRTTFVHYPADTGVT